MNERMRDDVYHWLPSQYTFQETFLPVNPYWEGDLYNHMSQESKVSSLREKDKWIPDASWKRQILQSREMELERRSQGD